MLDEGCVRALLSGSAPEGCPRHQYDGGWGYESGLLPLGGVNPRLAPIRLLHVGWRWYQPDIGRFIQRDPLGVRGGLNVYAYGANRPPGVADPTGLQGLLCEFCGRAGMHRDSCPLHPRHWERRRGGGKAPGGGDGGWRIAAR